MLSRSCNSHSPRKSRGPVLPSSINGVQQRARFLQETALKTYSRSRRSTLQALSSKVTQTRSHAAQDFICLWRIRCISGDGPRSGETLLGKPLDIFPRRLAYMVHCLRFPVVVRHVALVSSLFASCIGSTSRRASCLISLDQSLVGVSAARHLTFSF